MPRPVSIDTRWSSLAYFFLVRIQMTEIAQPHRGMELAHFCVSAGTDDPLRTAYAEILEVIHAFPERRVSADHRAALHGVEHLRRVEGEHGRIAEVCGTDAIFLHAEGVRGVVDHLEVVFFRDRSDRARVAEVAVDVHGDDGGGLGRDERFNLRRVHRVGHGVDVAEDGLETVSRDRVRRGDEGERRRDHFAREPHSGDDRLEREVTVCEQGHLLRAEIVLQRSLEPLMFFTHVGQPVAVP